LAGPIAMSLGPIVSAHWFPPLERTTSTAIIGLSNYVGGGFSFLIGPLIVPDEGGLEERIKNLRIYLISEAVFFGLFFLLCILYFPKNPPISPSKTA